MFDIHRVSAADVRPKRIGAPEVHLHDGSPAAVHLAALVDGDVVAVVSAFDVGRTGAPSTTEWLVYGPFGRPAAHEALMHALSAHLPPGAVTWRDPDDARSPGDPPRYDASSIEVLTASEAIRKRPGMFVGGTGRAALCTLVAELTSNAVDEHLAGHARSLSVATDGVGYTVSDDGRGLPVDLAPEALLRWFTELHAGSTRDGHRPHVHLRPHGGVGLCAVAALSALCAVTVDRAGRRWQAVFARGAALAPFVDLGPAPPGARGTSVRFVPDPDVFDADALVPDLGAFTDTLRAVAHLVPGLAITVGGVALDGRSGTYGLALGYAPAAVRLARTVRGEHGGVTVDAAVLWSGFGEADVHGFANLVPSVGSHVRGLFRAVGAAGLPREGLVAVVAVTLPEARFAGRVRERLVVDEAEQAVLAVVGPALAAVRAGVTGPTG